MTQELENRVSVIEKKLDALPEAINSLDRSITDLKVSIATFAANWTHYEKPGDARICQIHEDQLKASADLYKDINHKLEATRRIVFIIVGIGIAANFLQPYLLKAIGG